MIVEKIFEPTEKARVGFCHGCSNKLRGNFHFIIIFKNIDHDFVYHKSCAETLDGYDKSKIEKYKKPDPPGPF